MRFRWRDRHGYLQSPKSMDTQRLYDTTLNVWCHLAPKEQRFPGRQHTWSAFYTPKYMHQALKVLALELSTRPDMRPGKKKIFDQMVEWAQAKNKGG